MLIEMHLYDVQEFKFKTIRSWAAAYAGELRAGAEYSSQKPVICVSFINDSLEENKIDKVHKYCKILDMDTKEVFTDALELHYINMQAFTNAINKASITDMTKLEKWLAVLAEKDVADKAVVKAVCEQEEDLNMAISTLQRLSLDKPTQEEYRRHREEMWRREASDREKAELARVNAEQTKALAEERKANEEKDKALAEKDKVLAEQEKTLAEKDSTMLNMSRIIEEYKAKFGEIAQ